MPADRDIRGACRRHGRRAAAPVTWARARVDAKDARTRSAVDMNVLDQRVRGQADRISVVARAAGVRDRRAEPVGACLGDRVAKSDMRHGGFGFSRKIFRLPSTALGGMPSNVDGMKAEATGKNPSLRRQVRFPPCPCPLLVPWRLELHGIQAL
jgi:hypothetical protein